MGSTNRAVEACPHRLAASPGEQVAVCRVLAELTDLKDTRLCEVGRDACEACCNWFQPSVDHANPVISSLLYRLTAELIQIGGAPGCDRVRAEHLNRLAERTLPTEEEVSDPSLQLAAGATPAIESREPIEQLIPLPSRKGRGIRKWAVGMTTAPRSVPTLEQCLQGVARAGWEGVHLFVDGELELPEYAAGIPRTVRAPAVGVWPNYYLSLLELLERQPEADAFLIVQDDALFLDRPTLRRYLSQVLWQGDRPQMASLFCPSDYTSARAGWHRFKGTWRLGPVAFAFSRGAVERFSTDPFLRRLRATQQRRGIPGIGSLIGEWADRARIPIYFPTPSLVQHIGHTSTLWSNALAFGSRRASRFGSGS